MQVFFDILFKKTDNFSNIPIGAIKDGTKILHSKNGRYSAIKSPREWKAANLPRVK